MNRTFAFHRKTARAAAITILAAASAAALSGPAAALPADPQVGGACGWGTTSYPNGAFLTTDNGTFMRCTNGDWIFLWYVS